MLSNHSRSKRSWPHDGCHALTKHIPKLYAIFITSCLLFSGCQSEQKPTTFEGMMMHIPYRILIGQPLDAHQIEKIENIITQTFFHIDHVYNNWNPSSEISFLSRLKARETVALSSGLQSLLEKVNELYIKSEGLFDVTIAPLAKLWKQGKPDQNALKSVSSAIGWNKVNLQNSLFWKEHTQTTFDLGGIAKGYAVDLLTENLVKAGFDNIFVEWGGEICTRGMHPQGRLWKVGIEKKELVIELNNQAIATSGDDYQYWKIEGIDYIHIIDPRTQTPLIKKNHSISSVTVVASSCLLADALATILMLFETPEEAKAWLCTHYPEARCWICMNNSLSE